MLEKTTGEQKYHGTHTHTHTYTCRMIKKMDEWRKRKNVKNEEGRKNHRRLMNKSKRAKVKAKKKYLHNI
jgi:hypothetical protein